MINEHRAALAELARNHSPAYVYALDAIRDNAHRLVSTFVGAGIYYAMKANPLAEVVRALAAIVAGVEVASIGELEYATSLGVPAQRLILTGPAKSAEEITTAVRTGIGTLNIESIRELRLAAAVKRQTASPTRLAIRVDSGSSPSRFGFDAESLPAIAKEPAMAAVRGLHVYAETQVLDVDQLERQFSRTIALAERFEAISGVRLEQLNVGGGFGVPHLPGQAELDTAEVARRLRRLISSASLSAGMQMIIEPGRYLTAPYGALVTTVRAVKASRGTSFVLTDCGCNGFLLPVLTGQPHPVLRLAPHVAAEEERPEPAIVGGPLCIPIDTIAQTSEWSAAEGQHLVIPNVGAYGWSLSPQFFQGQPTIAEAVLDGGELRVVRNPVPPTTYLRLGRTSRPTNADVRTGQPDS